MFEISKKLLRVVGQTNARYKMFEKGDKILLGLSGGKDSITLAHLLKHFSSVTPEKFEFRAVTITYGIGEELAFLHEHCLQNGIDHEFIDTKIYEIGKEKVRENSTFCSFCSRMRRGYLYSYALEHGFNKVALGHHLDDAAESFFMNFTYNGALRTLPPRYTASNGLGVIRPLICVRERQIRDCIAKNGTRVVGCDACPARKFGKEPFARANTKELLANLEQANPKLFVSLQAAFENVHLASFFGMATEGEDEKCEE